jgi:phosphoglycolate phosphatase
MIAHLVFDLDGTLVPSNDVKRDAFFACVEHIDGAAEIIAAMLAADSTRDRYRVFGELTERLPEAGDADVLIARYSRLCHESIVALLRSGGTDALLAHLASRGLVLHLSSGTPREALVAMMEETGLAHHFSSIHGAPGAKADKLRGIMREHGLGPSNLAVIGDGDSDAEAAREAGCQFLRVAGDASDLHGRPAEEGVAFLAQGLGMTAEGAAA